MGMKRPVCFLSILNPGRSITKWLLISLVIVLLFLGGRFIYEEANRLPPDEAVKQSLTKTLNAETYRFKVTAKRSQDGQEAVISEISGEKSLDGVHLQGSLPLIKAEVEIIHLGDQLYRKDIYTKKWVTVPAEGRIGLEQLITELNPLSVFKFTDGSFEVKEAGKEKVAGQTCRVYEIMTKGENKYLQLFWQDFNYILWVDKKDGLLRQARISGEHREMVNHTLSIEVLFFDYHVPFELKPPLE
jgi:hypothetical protein